MSDEFDIIGRLRVNGLSEIENIKAKIASVGGAFSGISSQVGGATSGLSSFHSKLSGAVSGFSSFAANAASFAVGGVLQMAFEKVAGAIGQVKAAMIDGNAEMEQYAIKFKVMLGGSEEAASSLLGQLQKFGNETPFEFPGLAKNATLLKSFGIATEDLLPTLKMLGDVSGGSQEKLDGLALVFAQVSSAGKLSGQDLMQLINQGFNPLEAISKRTGRSMADLKEDMSKGKITFDMVKQAFIDVTSEGGMFNGMMKAQSTSAKGLQSTFNDLMATAGRTIGKPFFDMYKQGLQRSLDMLSSPAVQGAIENFANWISGTLVPAWQNLSAQISEQVMPILATLGAWFVLVGLPALLQFSQYVSNTVVPALQNFGAHIAEQILPVAQQMAAFFVNEIAPAFIKLAEVAVTQLVPGLMVLGSWILQLVDWILQLASFTLPILMGATKLMIDNWQIFAGVGAAIGIVIAALNAPILFIAGTIVVLATAWANNWGGIREITFSVINAVKNVIDAALNVIKAWWQQHGDNVLIIINFLWETAKTIFFTTLQVISDYISATLEAIKLFWSEWGDEITMIIQFAWDTIVIIVTTSLSILSSLIDAAAALIKGNWFAFGEALGTIWRNVWEAIKSILSNAVGALGSIAQEIIDNLLGKFNNTDWAAIGRAIIERIIQGLRAYEQRVYDWVQQMIDRILNAINNALMGARAALSSATAPPSGGGAPPPAPPTNGGFEERYYRAASGGGSTVVNLTVYSSESGASLIQSSYNFALAMGGVNTG